MADTSKNEGGMPDLTRNQALVYDQLERVHGPMSAYTILDNLRDAGMRAPLQVYRALEKLVALGKVHKLESLNAYIACSHPHCAAHSVSAFSICETCETVQEIADDSLTESLEHIAARQSFLSLRSVVELRGVCADCRKSAP